MIQGLQQLPPRLFFQRTSASRGIVRWLLPALARAGVLPSLFGLAARRFLFGATEVQLRARAEQPGP